MIDCPCGSKNKYDQCCEPYLTKTQYPKTPEALMRSRYTAYTLANIDYIKKTMRGPALFGFDEEDAKRWAARVTWMGLKVFQASSEKPTQNKGYVEFEAKFMENYDLKSIHEKSEFIREKNRWYYVDGTQL
ncbi:MAG: YchJ family metal-binding protein [Legionella sp.]|nr:YchJ family metal-binding protein [Legionella sp.]